MVFSPECVELLDDHSEQATNRDEDISTYSHPSSVMAAVNGAGLVSKSYPVRDTLFFKLQGTPTAIKETSAAVQQIVKKHGSNQFQFASTDQEAEELWENRKYALTSTITSGGPDARVWTTDVWSVTSY